MIPNLISGLSALSSSVYPDAGTLRSFPLHGSVFTTGNSGIAWFSQAVSSLGELTCPDQGKTASLGEHKPVLEKPFPSLAASAILDISLGTGQKTHVGMSAQRLSGWPDSMSWFQSFISYSTDNHQARIKHICQMLVNLGLKGWSRIKLASTHGQH